MSNNYPKLHNATWPGVVGKDPDSDQPPIDLETMLTMTAAAEVDGKKFDGVDIFLCAPHVDIDSTDEQLDAVIARCRELNLEIGSLVAPVWEPTGGGSAMGTQEERDRFVEQVRKACRIGKYFRDAGIRPNGVIRIDSSDNPANWAADPEANTKLIAETFAKAGEVAAEFGERLAAEGEICWGAMHSWKEMVKTLEATGKDNVGFQADMAHTLLYTMGYNAPDDRILPEDYDWADQSVLDDALGKVTAALRPWTIDFHVAQNDATVHGTGSHDKTGRHCQATDPNGKLDIAKHAGFWLRDESGELTKACRHICWDGCMFPNEIMTDAKTWNDILKAMLDVREAHGWSE